jgi:hypothetical protein
MLACLRQSGLRVSGVVQSEPRLRLLHVAFDRRAFHEQLEEARDVAASEMRME